MKKIIDSFFFFQLKKFFKHNLAFIYRAKINYFKYKFIEKMLYLEDYLESENIYHF